MDQALRKQWMMVQQDQQISEAIDRERPRLRNFIRKRVADQSDAEDILQDVFYELVEAYRMMKPVEQVSAWLFRVARNRITDLFRRKKREALEANRPSRPRMARTFRVGRLAALAGCRAGSCLRTTCVVGGMDAASTNCPKSSAKCSWPMSSWATASRSSRNETGVSVNTLLSRKHYAVLHLRQRLQAIYDEFRKA